MHALHPTRSTPQDGTRQSFADLHDALRNAAAVLNIGAEVCATGHALISRIPAGAPSATSPAAVKSLAAKRQKSSDTIRYHIGRLIEAGLAQNRCIGNGGRRCLRNHAGELVEIFGIDFTPLVARAAEFSRQVDEQRARQVEHARLCHDISRLRRGMSRLVEQSPNPAHRSTWVSLPRRLASLGVCELRRVMDVVKKLRNALTTADHETGGQEISQDRPGRSSNQYTTDQVISDPCNGPMLAENGESSERPSPETNRSTCGLEHISFEMILEIAPDDWRMAMDRHGRPSHHNLVGTAYQRAHAMDVSPCAWAQAQSALGPLGASILILLADVQSYERGGRIRSPGGWVRRMSERAETGEAQLHRSVFGLLHRKEAK